MMASSSTAAYLMHGYPLDHEAEKYLRRAIILGQGRGSGGVPSAFPSTVFELTWTVSTLLEAGFSFEDLGSQGLTKIRRYLDIELSRGKGIVGFGTNFSRHGLEFKIYLWAQYIRLPLIDIIYTVLTRFSLLLSVGPSTK